MSQSYLSKLQTQVFSLFHTPNLDNSYVVHLIGKEMGRLDNLSFIETKDILGYGKTMEEAAKAVWQKKIGNEE